MSVRQTDIFVCLFVVVVVAVVVVVVVVFMYVMRFLPFEIIKSFSCPVSSCKLAAVDRRSVCSLT